ncbi:MAG: hypothetical protein MUO38_04425 [Anaerolineales bacterium]|nr:hypothetical protein [Anaerolineales bacterium]
MKRILLVVLVLALCLSACGGTATSVPTAIPLPTPTLTALSTPWAPFVAPVTVTMVNQSGQRICYVYAGRTTDPNLGDNRIDPSNSVYPGESRTFEIEPGNWNMSAGGCAYTGIVQYVVIGEVDGVTVTASGYEWVVMPAPETLRIINNWPGTSICNVEISPTGNPRWGYDWLPDEHAIIHEGESCSFNVPPGAYDIRVGSCLPGNWYPEWRGITITDSLTTLTAGS